MCLSIFDNRKIIFVSYYSEIRGEIKLSIIPKYFIQFSVFPIRIKRNNYLASLIKFLSKNVSKDR